MRRNHFGVQHQINIEIFLKVVASLADKLHVANTGDCMFNAVLFGEDTGDHVYFVNRRDGNKNVRAVYVGVVHSYGACAVGGYRQHVQIIFHGG